MLDVGISLALITPLHKKSCIPLNAWLVVAMLRDLIGDFNKFLHRLSKVCTIFQRVRVIEREEERIISYRAFPQAKHSAWLGS